MLELQASLIFKPTTMVGFNCRVEKIVELPLEEFIALKHRPNAHYSFIAESDDFMGEYDGCYHCLLALNKDGRGGILINADGCEYVRLGGYVANARGFVEQDMKETVEFFLQELPRDEETGNICITLEDIGEYSEDNIWESSVIARMFLHILAEHPGVAGVSVSGDCLVVTPAPEQTQGMADGLKLRDILLLGGMDSVYMVHDTADVGFVSLAHFEMLGEIGRTEHADVLNASVREIRPGPCGTEIVLSGVEPQAMENLDREAAEHMKAGGMKGPGM